MIRCTGIRKIGSFTAITTAINLPLYIFTGEHLLCAKLRRSNIDGAAGAREEVECIVAQIRERWPIVKIILRADRPGAPPTSEAPRAGSSRSTRIDPRPRLRDDPY